MSSEYIIDILDDENDDDKVCLVEILEDDDEDDDIIEIVIHQSYDINCVDLICTSV